MIRCSRFDDRITGDLQIELLLERGYDYNAMELVLTSSIV